MQKPFLSEETISKKIINLEFANPFRIICDGEFVDFEMSRNGSCEIRRLKMEQFHELLGLLNGWVGVSLPAARIVPPPSQRRPKPTWKPIAELKTELSNVKRNWSQEDKSKTANLLCNGLSYKQISPIIGRTVAAIMKQHSEGNLPGAPPYKPNPHCQNMGLLGAIAKAEKKAQLNKESTK